MAESVHKKLRRVRAPRVNITYDVEVGGAIEMKELPFIVGILAICQYAALIKFWPYDLSLSLNNYQFDKMDGGGWASYFNSIKLGLPLL